MADDTAHTDSSSVVSVIRSARLVYGCVLVDNRPRLIECVDRETFEDDAVDLARYTAYNNIGADLVPIVHEADLESGDRSMVDSPHITTFEGAVSAIDDARAYYVLANTEPGSWSRMRTVVSDAFEAGDEIDDPEEGRYVVASTLVDDATAHIAELPPGVDPDDIDLIDWSG